MAKSLTPSEPKKRRNSSQLVAQSFSGPLPPPSLLNQYDEDTRKTIVDMAYQQSTHRQFLEKSVVSSNITNEKIGMFIATGITLFMIGGGIYLLMNDKNGIGFTLIFGPSLFQAGNYIYNKYQEHKIEKKPTDNN